MEFELSLIKHLIPAGFDDVMILSSIVILVLGMIPMSWS